MPRARALMRIGAPDKGPRITRLPLDSLGLAQHVRPAPADNLPLDVDDITPWDRVLARLDAVKDVAARPDHHATRLRRWYARQAGRRAQGVMARPSPLLPGRAQSLRRWDHLNPTRRMQDPSQVLLWEASQFAFAADAAAHGMGRGVKPPP